MLIPILITGIYAAALLLMIVFGLMLLSRIRLGHKSTGKILAGLLLTICSIIVMDSLIYTGSQTSGASSSSISGNSSTPSANSKNLHIAKYGFR